jgi:hypothetical protein
VTLPLFDPVPHDPRYPVDLLGLTRDFHGLRVLDLGLQDDYVVVLGHPAWDRVEHLVTTVMDARDLTKWGFPDEDELFHTWARLVGVCPDTADHRADDGEDDWEDGCWTCDTQVVPRSGCRYLDWRISSKAADAGKNDENADKPDYFPVVVWQINTAIGFI